MWPIAFVIGVDAYECREAAKLIGWWVDRLVDWLVDNLLVD